MKTKNALFRLVAGVFLITLIHFQGVSQDLEHAELSAVSTAIISDINNQPLIFEDAEPIDYWMVCDFCFENVNEDCFVVEGWMLDLEMADISHEDYYPYYSEWMLADHMDVEREDIPFMDWMFEFEPFVIDELMQGVEEVEVEKWMLENEFMTNVFDYFEEGVVKSWMLCFDFGLIHPEIMFENWMLDAFSMN